MSSLLSIMGYGRGNKSQFFPRNNDPKKVDCLPEATFGSVSEPCIGNLLKCSNILCTQHNLLMHRLLNQPQNMWTLQASTTTSACGFQSSL